MGDGEPIRRVISWDEYNELVSSIAAQIGDKVPDCIVGLTRGGLIPAVQFSHMFNVKKYSNILIVDDINDSGATLWEVANQCYGREICKPRFATLLSKDSSEFDNLIAGEHINKNKDNEWIVFPWE